MTLIERPDAGVYVGIEGAGGVGKTYFMEKLDSVMEVELVPEFADQGVGKAIFDLLEESGDEFFRLGHPIVENLLFRSMKIHQLETSVVPLLERGDVVVQDRAFYGTSVYSAVLIDRNTETRSKEEYFTDLHESREPMGFQPDVSILLQDDFENCLERIQQREQRQFRDDEVEIMRAVHDLYSELPERFPDHVYELDLRGKDDEAVLDELWAVVSEFR